MVSRYEFYRVKRGNNLADPEFWNPRFQDLDNRMTARELDKTKIDDAVDALEAVALQRLNDTFAPLIVEAQDRLNNLGASFSAESLDSETIGLGTKVFTLTEETAANYVFTDYVNIRAAAESGQSMLGQVISFDRPSGNLTVDVVHTEGSGTYADWLIRVGAPIDLSHADRIDNPHMTTAAQVGAYTIAQTDAAIAAAIAAIPAASYLVPANNLSDLTDAPSARTALGLGAIATLSQVGSGEIASSVWATAAQIRNKTAGKGVQISTLYDAAAYVGLSDAATVVWDHNNGINFTVTLGASRTLAFPTNAKIGQSGLIEVVQPGGGGASVGFASGFIFDQGVVPTVDTSAGRKTYLYYHCRDASNVLIGVAFKGAR